MNMSDTVIVTRDAATTSIAILTFNRPDVFNAMNDELINALREKTVALAQQADIRALIIKGAGKAFLAGGDVGSFYARRNDTDLAQQVKAMGDALHDALIAIRNMPYPVIAQVQGACAGAGVSLALACDLIVASDRASFNTAYTKIGVSPDGGSTWFLPRMVGLRKATELIMLSETIDAASALSLGLVNRVVAAEALEAEVAALATRLASGATQAYASAKRLLNQSFETPMRRQMDNEIAGFAACTATADFKEGVTAFIEKRKPDFSGK
jgi:2-(1,2-epoxy-1,2-dihydrophenyl)acetyl-CoA isomerase